MAAGWDGCAGNGACGGACVGAWCGVNRIPCHWTFGARVFGCTLSIHHLTMVGTETQNVQKGLETIPTFAHVRSWLAAGNDCI